jgi:hypothetical protein
MNGNGNPGAYDVGVEIGTQGIGAGGNDYQTATIMVAWPGLTISHLGFQRFGVRLTLVGAPTGTRYNSSKISGTSCACLTTSYKQREYICANEKNGKTTLTNQP